MRQQTGWGDHARLGRTAIAPCWARGVYLLLNAICPEAIRPASGAAPSFGGCRSLGTLPIRRRNETAGGRPFLAAADADVFDPFAISTAGDGGCSTKERPWSESPPADSATGAGAALAHLSPRSFVPMGDLC